MTELLEEIKNMPTYDLRLIATTIYLYSKRISDGCDFELSGKRWVLRPENFVTIELHAISRNIRVSIRGYKEEFFEFDDLPLNKGMSGYSEFVISDIFQIKSALFYISRSLNIYKAGRNRRKQRQIICYMNI